MFSFTIKYIHNRSAFISSMHHISRCILVRKEPIDKNLAKLIISISPRLLKKLDEWAEEKGFKSRSEAVRYIIRRYLEEGGR